MERGETLACGFRLRAGWVETDNLFVELLRVSDVMLPLFELGGLEQFLRLIPAAGSKDNTEHNGPYMNPSSHRYPDILTLFALSAGHVGLWRPSRQRVQFHVTIHGRVVKHHANRLTQRATHAAAKIDRYHTAAR